MEVRTELVIAEEAEIDEAVIADTLDVATATLFRVPMFATADIPAAAAGNEGMIVYDTTANKLKMSTGAAWEAITSA
jgi:hypothetical protein